MPEYEESTAPYHIYYQSGSGLSGVKILDVWETGYAGLGEIYYTSGNVGIGFSDPNETLHVNGSANITGTLTAGAIIMDEVAGNNLTIGGDRNSSIDNDTFFVNADSDNVGIGLDNPFRTLHVKGDSIMVEGNTGNSMIEIKTATNTSQSRIYFASPNHGSAGHISYWHSMDALHIGTNATDRMIITSSGVAIGTGIATQKLHVNGSVNITQSMFAGNVEISGNTMNTTAGNATITSAGGSVIIRLG